jgi:FK506-binding protein 8
MEIGELALVRTSPRFAYGRQGRSPDIPTNASITYELELLEVQPPVDFATVTEKELTTLIDRKRIRGNELFQRKDYELAVNSYDKALKLIESYTEKHASEELPLTVSDMHIRCLNNLAAAYLKVERYKESQEACCKVLAKDPENVKALFRYGKVLAIQGELDDSVKILQKALELNPDERAIQVELQKAQKKKERVEREEREMYRRMVQGSSQRPQQTGSRQETSLWKRLLQGPIPYIAVAGLVGVVGMAIAYYLTQQPRQLPGL